MEQTGSLARDDAPTLAWRRSDGRGPTVVFFPGYRSDMGGDKAQAIAGWCAARGRALLRFDYAGHGASGGAFEDGTIGGWTRDAVDVIGHAAAGDLLLVGSSMGGWIALLAALVLGRRVTGLLGIAAAPDFTEDLMWASMMPVERNALARDGRVMVPSAYGDAYPITRLLIEEGRAHLVLRNPIPLACPVRLLHGQRDPDVPWETALRLTSRLEPSDVRVTLVKDGDHRLSRPTDLSLLLATLGELLGEDAG